MDLGDCFKICMKNGQIYTTKHQKILNKWLDELLLAHKKRNGVGVGS